MASILNWIRRKQHRRWSNAVGSWAAQTDTWEKV